MIFHLSFIRSTEYSSDSKLDYLPLVIYQAERRHFRHEIIFKNDSFSAHSQRFNIVGSLHDRELACSASDHQGSNFESYIWRAVSSHSSDHPQEFILAQFSLYVHKGGLKTHSFHFYSCQNCLLLVSTS